MIVPSGLHYKQIGSQQVNAGPGECRIRTTAKQSKCLSISWKMLGVVVPARLASGRLRNIPGDHDVRASEPDNGVVIPGGGWESKNLPQIVRLFRKRFWVQMRLQVSLRMQTSRAGPDQQVPAPSVGAGAPALARKIRN